MRILLLLSAIAVVGFLFWRWRGRDDSGDGRRVHRVTPAPVDEPQIILRPGAGACSVARQQAGRSFGSNEMPRLPLPGCRASACNCRFETIAGRRRQHRRETGERRETIRYDEGGGERREHDRRKSGADPWAIDPESDRE